MKDLYFFFFFIYNLIFFFSSPPYCTKCLSQRKTKVHSLVFIYLIHLTSNNIEKYNFNFFITEDKMKETTVKPVET